MAIDLSTAGIHLKYAVEATAGTRPTSSYIDLAGVKSIPDFNPEPSMLETTTLNETTYRTYIPGLKDMGDAKAFRFNFTDAFSSLWASLMSAYTTAASSNKATWFEVVIPGITKAFYFAGQPSPLGLSAIDVDAVLEIDAYITPTSEPIWEAKST